MNLSIEPPRTSEELRECADLMSSMEPWITLRRGYGQSLETLTDPLSEVYVARVGGGLVGFAIIQLRGPFAGYVKSILVKPGWQGRGVGRGVMGFLEGRIFSEHPNVFLCVSSFNRRAQEFYRGMGYEVVGELRDYVVRGHSEILMRKTVSPIADFRPG
jgi:ribosomal protein S18 acetylase RimI-like enzyme